MPAFRRAVGLVAAGVILVGSVPVATIAQDASPSAATAVPATQPKLTDAVDIAIAAAGAELAGDPAAPGAGVPNSVRAYVATNIVPETYAGVLRASRRATRSRSRVLRLPRSSDWPRTWTLAIPC